MKLIDGEEMHRLYPDTFWIPSKEEKDAVKLCDLVKVILTDDNGHYGVKVWVSVAQIHDDKMEGLIANHPIISTYGRYGDRVQFEKKNIIDIQILKEQDKVNYHEQV